MLKVYEVLKSLRTDKAGVVSFEYIIVAACIVATVLVVFGSDGNSTIGAGLKAGIDAIVAKLTV
jgi:pilus assembly protein Flp/PilA